MSNLYVAELCLETQQGKLTLQVIQEGCDETDARYRLFSKARQLTNKRVLHTTIANCSPVKQNLRDVDGVLDYE